MASSAPDYFPTKHQNRLITFIGPRSQLWLSWGGARPGPDLRAFKAWGAGSQAERGQVPYAGTPADVLTAITLGSFQGNAGSMTTRLEASVLPHVSESPHLVRISGN